jgi:hypothetical protein
MNPAQKMAPGTLAAVWVMLTDDRGAPPTGILNSFAAYVSRGGWYADDFLIAIVESSLVEHASPTARALWIAELIGAPQSPTDSITIVAA